MRQFLVAAVRPGAVLELAGSDYHYLVRVLRLRPGAVIPVADAAGHRARATLTDGGDGRMRLVVHQPRTTSPAPAAASRPAPRTPDGTADVADEPGHRITLIQALPRGALMDRIVRQATELGVACIVPVVAERSQGRADPAAHARRRQRWHRIARQAAQQSGSMPPAIEPPAPLRRYLAEPAPAGIALLLAPGADPLLAGARLRRTDARAPTGELMPLWSAGAGAGAGSGQPHAPAYSSKPHAGPRADAAAPAAREASTAVPAARTLEVRCAVGPEGGFSPAEAELFRACGFHAVGLPGGVLRVDTAMVAALASVRQFLESRPGP